MYRRAPFSRQNSHMVQEREFVEYGSAVLQNMPSSVYCEPNYTLVLLNIDITHNISTYRYNKNIQITKIYVT